MSTVTTYLGLTKPAGIEQFNLATYNNNLDLADNAYLRAMIAPAIMGWDAGATTWGAAPTNVATTNFKMLAASGVVTTDANGYAAITMPYAFPNGYLVVGGINGDDWARPSVYYNISTNIFTNTNNKFYIRAIQNGNTPLNGGVLRFSYTVVGW